MEPDNSKVPFSLWNRKRNVIQRFIENVKVSWSFDKKFVKSQERIHSHCSFSRIKSFVYNNVSLPRIVYRDSSTINHSVNQVLAITLGNVSNEGHPMISATWIAKPLRNSFVLPSDTRLNRKIKNARHARAINLLRESFTFVPFVRYKLRETVSSLSPPVIRQLYVKQDN